jgi:deazaflavin-dependent oxidoreductase (nitroreductase family)
MARRGADTVAAIMARIASALGPTAMRLVARVNKFVTNPLQKLWAPRLRHMAVIEHRGRKSGAVYRTPVMAFVGESSVCVVLNYGAESDWVRNVLAADAATVIHRRQHYRLSTPRVLSIESSELPDGVRAIGITGRQALRGELTAE